MTEDERIVQEAKLILEMVTHEVVEMLQRGKKHFDFNGKVQDGQLVALWMNNKVDLSR